MQVYVKQAIKNQIFGTNYKSVGSTINRHFSYPKIFSLEKKKILFDRKICKKNARLWLGLAHIIFPWNPNCSLRDMKSLSNFSPFLCSAAAESPSDDDVLR